MSAVGEHVVLLNEQGHAIGTADKVGVHHTATPLHLAFSCYLFDARGSVLLTRRALHKPTWPGAWTNSFCGHPGPGEILVEALHRRAQQELGVRLHDLRLVLPGFRYEAVMANGVRENEMCPVFTAGTADEVRPQDTEVADTAWVPWPDFRDDVRARRRAISPWCVEQVEALAGLERPEGGFAPADWDQLPPAARAGS